MIWVLIFTVLGSGRQNSFVAEFTSEQVCKSAGQSHEAALGFYSRKAVWSCWPKPTGKCSEEKLP